MKYPNLILTEIGSMIKPEPPPIIMTKTFGDYIEHLPDCHEYLRIQFSPSSIPLKQRWRNNGLSADFMADYLTTFFPQVVQIIEGANLEEEFRHAVSYVANELLENAMKFSDRSISYPVDIILQLYDDKILFMVNNSVESSCVEKFQGFIEELLTEDPQELYIQHLENTADDLDSPNSGLGILTMINDYEAKVGWKFETMRSEPLLISVTTMVQLIF